MPPVASLSKGLRTPVRGTVQFPQRTTSDLLRQRLLHDTLHDLLVGKVRSPDERLGRHEEPRGIPPAGPPTHRPDTTTQGNKNATTGETGTEVSEVYRMWVYTKC